MPQLLRVKDVQQMTGYSRASLYRLEKIGRFPKRIKIGLGQGGAVGWRTEDVCHWIDKLPRIESQSIGSEQQ